MDKYLMALDAGSGSGKCLVVSLDGKKIFAAKKDWFYYTPDGLGSLAIEFQPDEFWRNFSDCIKETMKKGDIQGEDIVAISSTSQREGIVILDKEGKELYAGPNRDFRAVMEGIYIADTFGDEIYKRSGHYPNGIFGCSRLLWFKKNNPGLYNRFSTLLSINDWVLYRLCGEKVCEPTNASETALYDINKQEWMKDILEKLGLSDIFPEVKVAGSIIGSVTKGIAEETGLKSGTPVVVGAADTQCGLLGCGLLKSDEIAAISGTSTPIQMITGTPIFDPQIRTWANPYVVPGKFVLESNSGSSGSIFRWLRDTMCESEIMKTDENRAFAEMAKIAEQAPAGSKGMMAHFGVMIFNARKINLPLNIILLGSTPMTDGSRSGKALLLRAILDNLVYGVKANADQIFEVSGKQPNFMGLCGGLSNSDLYNQTVADVMQIPTRVPLCKEGSGIGTAICAGLGAGVFKNFTEGVQAMVHIEKTYDPNRQNMGRYENLYRKWLKSYLSFSQ